MDAGHASNEVCCGEVIGVLQYLLTPLVSPLRSSITLFDY